MINRIIAIILISLCLTALYAVNETEPNNLITDADSRPIISTKNLILTGSVNKTNDEYDWWKLSNELEGNLDFTISSTSNYAVYGLRNATTNSWVFQDIKSNQKVTLIKGYQYYLRVRNTNATLDNYTITLYDEATLPVELSSFNAFLTNTNNVSLNWTSQSESNMVGYNVFRANSNQQSDAVKINPAIIAATNTSIEQNYSFTDHSIDAGEYYYWLQSVEANNETAFHGPVHVSYNPGNDLPDPEYQYKHVLKGAYPNPFNPSTSIQYELAEAANVEIVIFNAKGQKVRTFNQSHNNKGTYDVLWDGLDENGASVNSGVYFYRMTAGKSVQNKKMLLVK